MPKVTVRVDTELCIAAANCVGVAPQLFQIGDDSFAEVLDSTGASAGHSHAFEADAKTLELLEEAAEACPTRAIQLEKP